jgi:hypothetical protein
MKKILAFVAAAFVLLAFSGCESMPSGDPAAALRDPTKGILVASVTADAGKLTNDGWFYVRKKGDKGDGVRLAASGLSLLGKDNDFPERSPRTGRLLAVPLEPGEYELFTWTLYIKALGGGYGYISPKTPPPPQAFTVSAGKITYLAYLHIDTITGKNIFGLPIPVGGNPEIADNFASDKALMLKKFPALSAWPMENAALSGAASWRLQ